MSTRISSLTTATVVALLAVPLAACSSPQSVHVTQTVATPGSGSSSTAPTATTSVAQPTLVPSQPSQEPSTATQPPSSEQTQTVTVDAPTQPTVTQTEAPKQDDKKKDKDKESKPGKSEESGTYTTYDNARYGYTIKVPSWMTSREADNGDGITVTAPTGGVMRTYVREISDVPDLVEAASEELAGEGVKVIDGRETGNGFVINGRIKGEDVYVRCVLGKVGSMACARWDTPHAKSSAYDRVVVETTSSLTPPTTT